MESAWELLQGFLGQSVPALSPTRGSTVLRLSLIEAFFYNFLVIETPNVLGLP